MRRSGIAWQLVCNRGTRLVRKIYRPLSIARKGSVGLKVAAACCIAVVLGLLTMRSASNSSARAKLVHPSYLPPSTQLGFPASQAVMSRAAALLVAEKDWNPQLFTQHPVAVAYGSFTDNRYFQSNARGAHPVGTRDVWQIIISGLHFPASCMEGATTCNPPYYPRLIIYIDDKTGTEIEAQAAGN